MGRIFEKRKERMFARWSKTAKAFTKVGKEIAIAVKIGGAEPSTNPRLRMAIQTARGLNMPKDRIESAIHRASSKDQASLSEVAYSGYGPHGIAIYIDTATDNPTRTVANVRSILVHNGGSLATSGSIDYLFKHQGVFRIRLQESQHQDLELDLIDSGLEEFDSDGSEATILTSFENFGAIQKALESKSIEVLSAGFQRQAQTLLELDEVKSKEIQTLIDELEEDDDVQHVFHNMQS